MLVLAVAPPAAQGARRPAVVVAVLPPKTTVQDLARMPTAALGLMSAGIGRVPGEQTYLDISQGNRVDDGLYDRLLPPPSDWLAIRQRASSAPADIVPGLLGSTLARAGVPIRAEPGSGAAALLGVDEGGSVATGGARCGIWRETHRIGGKRATPGMCPGLTVIRGTLPALAGVAAHLRGDDLLVALAAPPPPANHFLPVAIAGAGFGGELTSESTHVSGVVSSTDLAATILDRFGVPAPNAIAGQPITSSGARDPDGLTSLDARLATIPGRRSEVIGTSLAAWTAAAALAALAFRRRGARIALPLFACTIAYLPTMLLITAALEPGGTVETLVVALGAPALALASVGLAGAWGGAAIAAFVSLAACAVDVVTGSHLTIRSLIGPNPAHGNRFYGIGNQLEAVLAPLVPLGVGAALTALGTRTGRVAAVAFALAALVFAAAYAPGRFGADVGIAIDLSVGAVVAVAVCLGVRRRLPAVALALAVPIVAIGALAAIDLASGGDAHLTRSVLDAGGFHGLGQVAERRLRLSADNFAGYVGSPLLWTAVAAIVAGALGWRSIAAWFARRRYAWAGFLGAAAAAAAAVLVNDSGGLVLIIAVVPVALFAGIAWANSQTESPNPR